MKGNIVAVEQNTTMFQMTQYVMSAVSKAEIFPSPVSLKRKFPGETIPTSVDSEVKVTRSIPNVFLFKKNFFV
jgi:hypothetical protein